MKRLILVATMVLCAVSAAVGGGIITKDLNGAVVQGPSWDPNKSQLITSSASQTFDQSSNFAMSFTPVADCKGRIMPTSAKGSYPQFTLYATSEYVHVMAKEKPLFFNMSGCTGDYKAQ